MMDPEVIKLKANEARRSAKDALYVLFGVPAGIANEMIDRCVDQIVNCSILEITHAVAIAPENQSFRSPSDPCSNPKGHTWSGLENGMQECLWCRTRKPA